MKLDDLFSYESKQEYADGEILKNVMLKINHAGYWEGESFAWVRIDRRAGVVVFPDKTKIGIPFAFDWKA